MVILWIFCAVLLLAWILAVKGLLVLLIAGAGSLREGAIILGVLVAHTVFTVYAMSNAGGAGRLLIALLVMASLWGCLARLVRAFSRRRSSV